MFTTEDRRSQGHFASARLRAVEEGLPLVRAANTGISGVVDGYGRVRARLGLEEGGVIDADLPRAAALRTPYSIYGDLPAAIMALAVLLVVRLCEGRNASRPENLPGGRAELQKAAPDKPEVKRTGELSPSSGVLPTASRFSTTAARRSGQRHLHW